jgi:DNA-directed RNA polymerase specialized sigma24 family protein
VSWIKPSRWQGLPEHDSLEPPHSDPRANAERIERERATYLPYYDANKTGPIPKKVFAGRTDEKQRELERYFMGFLPHRVVLGAKVPTLRFLYEGGEPAPLMVERARRSPELLSEACYAVVLLVDAWVDRPDTAFDKAAYFRGLLRGRLIDLFRANAKHEYARVVCRTCAGERYIEGKKCSDCRGRGFHYLARVDPIENYIASDSDDESHTHVREEIDPRQNPEERLLSSGARAAVRAEIDRLPDFQRKLMYALFWSDLNETETARVLSKSQPTVNRGKRAALNFLRDSKLNSAPEPSRCTHRRNALRDWWGEMKARHTPYTLGRPQEGANRKAPLLFNLTVTD